MNKHTFLLPHALLILSAIMLCHCTHMKKEINERILYLEPEKTSTFDLQEIATFYAVVPLETADLCLIKNIRQVFFIDSCIVVWDDEMRNLLVFNDKGEYLHSLGPKGQGPREYIEISDVHTNPREKTISILDNGKRCITTYHISGKFISSETLPLFGYAFYQTKDGIWLLNMAQNPEKNNLLLLNNETKEIEFGFIPSKNFLTLLPTNNFFENEKDELFFHYPNEDMIYKLQEKELIPYLYVDFGKNKNPYRDINSRNYIDMIERNSYIGNIQNLYMYKDNLFFTFFEHLGKENRRLNKYYAFISLKDFNTIIYTNKDIKYTPEITMGISSSIIGLSDGKLIYQIMPSSFNNEDLLEKLKQSPCFKSMENINITLDSNPILVLYKLN